TFSAANLWAYISSSLGTASISSVNITQAAHKRDFAAHQPSLPSPTMSQRLLLALSLPPSTSPVHSLSVLSASATISVMVSYVRVVVQLLPAPAANIVAEHAPVVLLHSTTNLATGQVPRPDSASGLSCRCTTRNRLSEDHLAKDSLGGTVTTIRILQLGLHAQEEITTRALLLIVTKGAQLLRGELNSCTRGGDTWDLPKNKDGLPLPSFLLRLAVSQRVFPAIRFEPPMVLPFVWNARATATTATTTKTTTTTRKKTKKKKKDKEKKKMEIKDFLGPVATIFVAPLTEWRARAAALRAGGAGLRAWVGALELPPAVGQYVPRPRRLEALVAAAVKAGVESGVRAAVAAIKEEKEKEDEDLEERLAELKAVASWVLGGVTEEE
ncbi:hypothetical protein F5883DRAFT_691059, partial [Diaporthe sp. PMI_573]